MLHWSKASNETKLGSRIPVSQAKRSRSFRMNDNRKQRSTSSDFPTKNVYHTSRALEIVDSEKGNMSAKFELEPQRNIEAEVFDWLSKNSETSDKYTGEYNLESSASLCTNTVELHGITRNETASKPKEETLGITPERSTEMAKDGTGTKSYFNAFKNAIFPFEGKYFYLSGELNNHKVSLTETTKTIGDNSAHLMEKTKIIGDHAGRLVEKTNCDDDRYKEILGDRKSDNETKTTNKKWEINGLKDTKVYHEDQRMNEDKNGYVRYQYGCHKDKMPPLKINLTSDTYSESQKQEISRLRTQLEKLSAFVESSDERREQSETLLAQQNQELLKQIRQNKVLDNRVCCLEELRRNLQKKVDGISEEDESLKLALKSSEEKLVEEKERAQALMQECSKENAKNVELELVLQTIREELGCPSPTNNQNSSDLSLGTSHDDHEGDCAEELNETESNPSARHVEKKVRWGDVQTQEIKKTTESVSFNAEQQLWGPKLPETETTRPPQYSCLKQHPSEEALWKREKKQFEGKIMLLEMDKKKLRSEMDVLEAKIIKQATIGRTLRETNEVLEFRILELEYELLEKAKKQ